MYNNFVKKIINYVSNNTGLGEFYSYLLLIIFNVIIIVTYILCTFFLLNCFIVFGRIIFPLIFINIKIGTPFNHYYCHCSQFTY